MESIGRQVLSEYWETFHALLYDSQGADALAALGRLCLAMRMLHEVRVYERDHAHWLREKADQDEYGRAILREGAVYDSDFDTQSEVGSIGFSIDSDGHWHEHRGSPHWPEYWTDG